MSPEAIGYLVAGTAAIILTVARLAEGSKRIADLLGPVGRWLHRRYEHHQLLGREARIREYREALLDEKSQDYRALQRRTDSLYKQVNRLEAEVKQKARIEKLNAANWDMTAEYLRQDAQWHIRAGVLMAEQGIDLPVHCSYSKFCLEYRQKHRDDS